MSLVRSEIGFPAVYLFRQFSPHVARRHGLCLIFDKCTLKCLRPWVTLHWFFPNSWWYKSVLMYDWDNRKRACIIYTWPAKISALVRSRCCRQCRTTLHPPIFRAGKWMGDNKCSEHPVVIFWCGNARIHTLITAHTRKWVLTIPLHLAVPSCFHFLWITWLRAPPGPTGAENRSDLLFNSAGETVNIFLHFRLGEGGLNYMRTGENHTLVYKHIPSQGQMETL